MTELKEIELVHPIYGKFICNKFYSVKFYDKINKVIINYDNYKVLITNNIENPFSVYNKCTNEKLSYKPNLDFQLTYNGKVKGRRIHNIMLSSVFYEYILQNEYIKNIDEIHFDHIDDDCTNNLLENLQILSSLDNTRKGQQKSVKNSNEKGGRNGKQVMLTLLNKKNKEYEDFKEFQSIGALVKFLIDNNLCIDKSENEKKYDTMCSTFLDIIKKRKKSYNKKQFSAYEIEIEDIDNEIWKIIPKMLYHTFKDNKQYFISNKGRVKNLYGDLMTLERDRYDKYSSVQLNTKHYYIHHLVYISFNPENLYKINFSFNKKNKNEDEIKALNLMNIGHNDDAPKHKENGRVFYRNYLEDLYLTSQSDNMKDWHNSKDNENEIINIDKKNMFENKELIENTIIQVNKKGEIKEINKNSLYYIMTHLPMYLQEFQESKTRGFKYSLSKKITIHNLNLNGSKYISRKAKFLQALYSYNHFKNDNKVEFNLNDLIDELDNIEKKQFIELKEDVDKKLKDIKYKDYIIENNNDIIININEDIKEDTYSDLNSIVLSDSDIDI